MAFGPDKTLPIGTNKKRDIDAAVQRIDQIIENTEGNEVRIHPSRFNSLYKLKDELIEIYLKAGWKSVLWIDANSKTYDSHLLLSNK